MDKKLSTGNSLQIPFSGNLTLCSSVVLQPGNSSIEKLVSEISQGLYVKSFWYTRFTDPRKGGLTGLTRNGLFEIKDGQIGSAVSNLRYTDSFLAAFGPENILSVGNEQKMNRMNTTVPLALRKFSFSSKAHTM